MTDDPSYSEDEEQIQKAMVSLVMNCPELAELESRLSLFNIFRVLRADRNEIRHSNFLAWLFQPDEAHGLGESFLRRWLMRLMHDSSSAHPLPDGWVSPILVDAVEIDYVEVAREHENIDLLIVIHLLNGTRWVVCIENKVESIQHSNQLNRYFNYVERRYPDVERRIYVFLTKHDELPENLHFIQSSYSVIAEVLDSCIRSHQRSIGSEPLMLLNHYRQLLTEDFMAENESIRLARKIYQRHRKALDFIFENLSDPMSEAGDVLFRRLEEKAGELGISMEFTSKGWIRYVPNAWDVPQNKGNTGWGSVSRFLICEICLWNRKAELHMTVGRAPDSWAELVWQNASKPPFKQEQKKRPTAYIKPFKEKSDISLESLFAMEPEDMGTELYDWLVSVMQKPEYKQAVDKLAELLPALKAN